MKENNRITPNKTTDLPFVLLSPGEDSDNKTNIPLGSGTITSILGKGGMANVYEIWNPVLEMSRAVKLIHPTSTDIERERFDTEIKISAKLDHPNIVKIFGVGKWNGLSFLEMEKLAGVTLKDMINERGAMPTPVCTAIGIMISKALQYAHEQEYIIYGKTYKGIIHRDLKPSNIMLCNDGTVKLMDFGIARPTDASFHTMDGTVVGTIHYLPPEQLTGQELDVRTDVYSLGTTLYEILTGLRAFPEHNLSKLMAEKTKNQYKHLSDFTVQVPLELKRIIHKCMFYNREKRFGSAYKLNVKLQKIHDRLTTETPEEVIKNLINTRSYEKLAISSKKHILRDFAIVVAILISMGFSYYYAKKYVSYLKDIKIKQNAITNSNNRDSSDALKNYREQIDGSQPKPNRNTTKKRKAQLNKNNIVAHTKQSEIGITKKTFMDSLAEEYGTTSLLQIIPKLFRNGKTSDALRTYDFMDESLAANTVLVLYKIKILNKMKKHSELSQFLTEHELNDGEYFLAKARLAFQKKELAKTEKYLSTALKIPCKLLDRNTLNQEVYYYKALCATEMFDKDPTEKHYKNTLGAWHQLKTEMKNNQEHSYYKRANSEMQRIGTKYRDTKG